MVVGLAPPGELPATCKRCVVLTGTTPAGASVTLRTTERPENVRSGKELPMANIVRIAEVVWTGTIARGAGIASSGSGALRDLPITLASRFRDPEGKTSPEELIAAAHAGCFAMALGSTLAGMGTPPDELDVSARVTLETSGAPKISSSELEVRGVVTGIDQAAFEEAARGAGEQCLVSQALQGNVEIQVRATLDEPRASVA
jgi:lipoyl-dependent peroxiredoxin